MLVRHESIDVTLWCKSASGLTVYYARQVLSGKVGAADI